MCFDLLNIKDIYFIAFPKWTLENPSNKSQNKRNIVCKDTLTHTHILGTKQNKKNRVKIIKKYWKDWTEINKTMTKKSKSLMWHFKGKAKQKEKEKQSTNYDFEQTKSMSNAKFIKVC